MKREAANHDLPEPQRLMQRALPGRYKHHHDEQQGCRNWRSLEVLHLLAVRQRLGRHVVARQARDAAGHECDPVGGRLRQGAEAVYGTPEDFQKLMATEFVKYQKLVKDAGISAQ